ncbi:MAG: DUF3899 domain-containing protein [Clostridia bacterium]|nr:DUF3899 domain-containing protein [Clostridia bacterium]
MKKKLLKYGLPFLIGAAIAVAVAAGQGLGSVGAAMTMRALSDGCFVSTVLMGGLGLLIWVSTTGFFDIFSYAGKFALMAILPWKRLEKPVKFYDYKLEKEEHRKKGNHVLVIVGAVFLLLSVLFLLAYNSMIA